MFGCKGGRIWDFIKNECSDVPRSSFTCDFDTVDDKVADLLGARNTVISKAQGEGAVLVACGAKKSDQILMVQWIYPGKTKVTGCKNKTIVQPSVLTGCYRGDKQVDTSNPKKVVEDCFAE